MDETYKQCGCISTNRNHQRKSWWGISCKRAYGKYLVMTVAKATTKSSPVTSSSPCFHQWFARVLLVGPGGFNTGA